VTHEEEARGMTPEIYRKVCEARPELAVPNIDAEMVEYCPQNQKKSLDALILAHWLKMLPLGVGVWTCGGRLPSENWNCGHVKDPTATPCRQNVLDALAEFHVPGSTKGAE